MESLSVADARRLSLTRAGLLKPEWTGFPRGRKPSRREAPFDVIRRFGYLQLDTASVAGARSHGLLAHGLPYEFVDHLRSREVLNTQKPVEPGMFYWLKREGVPEAR